MTASEFEGRPVVGMQLILTNTGDGLSKAHAIRPVDLHHGDVIDLAVRARVAKVRFDAQKDDDTTVVRVNVLSAETITVVTDGRVDDLIQEQAEAERDAKLREGEDALPLDEAIEDLPEQADLEAVSASSIKAVLEFVPTVSDEARLRRLAVAERQTHGGTGRKVVLKAIATRLSEVQQ